MKTIQEKLDLPGTLQINNLAFHWLSGIEARKISYDNRRSGLRIDIAELKNECGLLHLIRSLNNVGTVDVKNPICYVYPIPPSPVR